jgi:electron transport complex protein RnfD
MRSAIVLLALAPGLALQARAQGAPLLGQLGLAVLLALVLETIALRLRAQPLRPFLAEGSAVLAAIMIVSWLPALAGWQLAVTIFVAIIGARQAFGGLGAQVFNPVMAAVAFAQLAFGSAPPSSQAGFDATALAWLVGGLVLCALRIVRWQLPLGLCAGALLASLATGRGPFAIASAPWLLAAFFIASDPASACEQPRARWLFAFAVGLLAVLAASDAPLAALPFALLAMNALAPALDRWLEPRRSRLATP